MEHQRKWTGWLLIAVIVIVAGTALVVTTLASPQPETSETPLASAPAPSTQPGQRPSGVGSLDTDMAGGQRTANASVIGYGGPVLVRLTLDEQNRIAALDIGGARFQETEGVGGKVRDAGFADAFIGKQPPLTLNEDVDAIAGASISSQAVVDAVNEAAAFLTENPMASDMN